MIFGCDEAGKGPVIGSMFVACVKGEPENIPSGVKDSKLLNNSKIHSLSERIRDTMNVSVIEATTSQIDDNQMTDLSVDKFSESIRSVEYNKCDSGFIDCFINNQETVESRLRSSVGLPEDYDLIVEFGADEKYPVVSAASIVAKSQREKHIDELSDEYGNIGSGYPSDPNTRDFIAEHIKENGEPPECARTSWSTIDDMLEEHL